MHRESSWFASVQNGQAHLKVAQKRSNGKKFSSLQLKWERIRRPGSQSGCLAGPKKVRSARDLQHRSFFGASLQTASFFLFNCNLYFHVDIDSMAFYPVSSSMNSCRLESLLPHLRSPCLEANLSEPLALHRFLFKYIGHEYIFGHSFVSIFLLGIYSDIRSCPICLYEYIRTFVGECGRV